ncbi:DUF2948 family protein [Pseudodonghicola flavimaris]|uniref:DUF2948 family protein n=1 Tax=Pseudodonghicola flavimaris TaxID=3050036 RepID=A0ABT7F3K7_9RHOB|nr:DUF2948 family protein [Pseudodonghicola flavimaris]MDK3019189.1 DUF2948 family protein [Pseudodonghicola flavimaris]
MTEDATFEEGGEAPLNLGAVDAEDLKVIAALTQDAIFTGADISWRPAQRRFALLLNRFRWEDRGRDRHGAERVRALLVIDEVLGVASQGVVPRDRDTVLSLLSIDFEAGEDGSGNLLLTLAGDGAIRLSVEALGVTLKDVTRPYRAISGQTPKHPE